MHVVDHADSGKKKLEIITLGKTRKLASIVEPYVDDTPHAGLPQDGEELLGCLFGKADREQRHADSLRVRSVIAYLVSLTGGMRCWYSQRAGPCMT